MFSVFIWCAKNTASEHDENYIKARLKKEIIRECIVKLQIVHCIQSYSSMYRMDELAT